ncbi:uncharacterized protein Z520_00339 [Fonsecaea multimorphosa CBS 102226]|uniref:Uncharacterized protein n=1 Tax=Fonsecaea multimorphosa CBS 102226 TaxID=1442371 RepID=A0A0D2KBZ9_9EURO|nr:uncharacterized protein Z520_00339 [Fonsecaea multimorphosa CBS 102226]KIY03648.1 hypothetical protein Z520_00339 [Fonsecaea multimorphosa CBS 102226]OAL32347.1 hypothetical protein AYO22_00369 [Fonsecaea multimorphosa]
MARSCSLLKPEPHRLLCLGAHHDMALKLQQKLAPHFTYCAILTKIEPKRTYSLDNFSLLLDALYPPPEGVIVGGGFSDEDGEQMRRLVEGRVDENGNPIKFVKVPSGTLEEKGPEGLVGTIRELLAGAFGVVW